MRARCPRSQEDNGPGKPAAPGSPRSQPELRAQSGKQLTLTNPEKLRFGRVALSPRIAVSVSAFRAPWGAVRPSSDRAARHRAGVEASRARPRRRPPRPLPDRLCRPCRGNPRPRFRGDTRRGGGHSRHAHQQSRHNGYATTVAGASAMLDAITAVREQGFDVAPLQTCGPAAATAPSAARLPPRPVSVPRETKRSGPPWPVPAVVGHAADARYKHHGQAQVPEDAQLADWSPGTAAAHPGGRPRRQREPTSEGRRGA